MGGGGWGVAAAAVDVVGGEEPLGVLALGWLAGPGEGRPEVQDAGAGGVRLTYVHGML